MFGVQEYAEYVKLQELADSLWRATGKYFCEYEAEKAQEDADAAYWRYEHAVGLRDLEC